MPLEPCRRDADNGATVDFSIVTPSLRNSQELKLCVASIADQEGVEVEHIVQDACSDDGTGDWLPHDRRVRAFIEEDGGMYDAINRGYRRTRGDILAHLNCDEQYLPGALKAVQGFFESHPHVDVVLAGSIVVDGACNYICHRHGMVPDARHIWFRFSMLTASLFLRSRVIRERGIFFDTRWRVAGDLDWILTLMKHQVPMAVFDRFTSVFADTGRNLGLKPLGICEAAAMRARVPRWVRLAKPLWIGQHRLRRLVAGHFFLKPTSYAVYTPQSPERRVHFEVPRPTAVWWNRL